MEITNERSCFINAFYGQLNALKTNPQRNDVIVQFLPKFLEEYKDEITKIQEYNSKDIAKRKCNSYQKYDIIKTHIDTMPHYAVVYKVLKEQNALIVISATTEENNLDLIPIKNSRILEGYFFRLYKVDLNRATVYFCGVYDDKKEFNNVVKQIKNRIRNEIK